MCCTVAKRNSTIEVFIPTPQQILAVFLNKPLDSIQFVSTETSAVLKSDRV